MLIGDNMEQDKKLSILDSFIGTQNYYDMGVLFRGIKITDGVRYVSENGYSYLVTDILSILTACRKIRRYLATDYFLSIVFIAYPNRKGEIIFSDGNGNTVFKKTYRYTDAEVDKIKFFYDERVKILMLASEW